MAIRRQRKVTTADKLYVKPKIERPEPVFGGFNKFVRAKGMQEPFAGGKYDLPTSHDCTFFVSPKCADEDWLQELSPNVVTIYDKSSFPKVLSPRHKLFPSRLTFDGYCKEWEDQSLIWSASLRDTVSPMDSVLALGQTSPPGYIFSLALAATEFELGFIVFRNSLDKRHTLNLHSLVAARQPGVSGGLRFRGISPLLLRLHDLAEDYSNANDLIYEQFDPIIPDEVTDDGDFSTH